MAPISVYTDVFPVKAVAFQFLFVLLAISIEAAVLHQRLSISRKLSMQYAATINLLTTCLGWITFFIIEPILPSNLRDLVIGYVFFGMRQVPTNLILVGFSMFVLTFLVKWQGMEWLDWLLGRVDPNTEAASKSNPDRPQFQGRKRSQHDARDRFAHEKNRPLAVLWANAFSFAAVSAILAIRLLSDQTIPLK